MKIYLGWAIIYQIMYHKSHVSHESMCSGRFADFQVMKIILIQKHLKNVSKLSQKQLKNWIIVFQGWYPKGATGGDIELKWEVDAMAKRWRGNIGGMVQFPFSGQIVCEWTVSYIRHMGCDIICANVLHYLIYNFPPI